MIFAGPAQAAPDGWVYLVVQNGNCRNNGTVRFVKGTVHTDQTFRQMWNGGDGPDNIIYPKVELNTTNVWQTVWL